MCRKDCGIYRFQCLVLRGMRPILSTLPPGTFLDILHYITQVPTLFSISISPSETLRIPTLPPVERKKFAFQPRPNAKPLAQARQQNN